MCIRSRTGGIAPATTWSQQQVVDEKVFSRSKTTNDKNHLLGASPEKKRYHRECASPLCPHSFYKLKTNSNCPLILNFDRNVVWHLCLQQLTTKNKKLFHLHPHLVLSSQTGVSVLFWISSHYGLSLASSVRDMLLMKWPDALLTR